MGLSKIQKKNLIKQHLKMDRMIKLKLAREIDIEWNQMADVIGVTNITLMNYRLKHFPESVKKINRK